MISVYLVNQKGRRLESVGFYDTLGLAVHDQRQLWMEDDEQDILILIYDDDLPMVAMTRPENDPEVCLTSWLRTGKVEKHRCHYVLDKHGSYLRTEITSYDAEKRVETPKITAETTTLWVHTGYVGS